MTIARQSLTTWDNFESARDGTTVCASVIGEQSLKNIIRAADPDDSDDVAIRKLLVSALRDIGADLTEVLHDPAAGSRPTLVNLAANRSAWCYMSTRTSGASSSGWRGGGGQGGGAVGRRLVGVVAFPEPSITTVSDPVACGMRAGCFDRSADGDSRCSP
jgi:hypothetical protein